MLSATLGRLVFGRPQVAHSAASVAHNQLPPIVALALRRLVHLVADRQRVHEEQLAHAHRTPSAVQLEGVRIGARALFHRVPARKLGLHRGDTARNVLPLQVDVAHRVVFGEQCFAFQVGHRRAVEATVGAARSNAARRVRLAVLRDVRLAALPFGFFVGTFLEHRRRFGPVGQGMKYVRADGVSWCGGYANVAEFKRYRATSNPH